ncbi:TonB-dependent receptor family protein [Membranicola marinus]|uniref:TonB-dependent receptor family protein n=1 Tax=Membranihabitans marinus TaxID=1227546 RepID=A0A953LCS4_9BACT|nr:TonB-dependent receptor [Membranihabitans marinus]MBY5958094.1 TonB-dependent receptor family protein [Membranihabitans marinus]
MIKHVIPILILIFSASQIGLTQKQGSVTGQLSDENDQPLPFATVTIYKAVDTVLLDYILSEDDGSFQFKKLPLDDTLRIIVSYLGYMPYKEDFKLTDNTKTKEFGAIKMTATSQTLDEILVQAERPPVVMHNDTLEFNASSFATRDGATVEDLVKKLPGVIVDNEGNITANGRPVTKVRVDGKDFFGGDPRVALRNLTSDMISKVQITDDREEDPQNLKADDEVSQILNLKLKEDAKIQAFGKAYAGKGTNDRFEVGGIVNNFDDTLQLSFVGYYNNLTETNLSMHEMLSLGSFSANRSWGGNGPTINGLSTGGSRAGLPRSLFGGANANATFGGAKFNLQYFYSNYKNEFGNQTFKETTVRPDSVFIFNSDNEGESTSRGHNVTGGLRWEIDTMTQLNINAGLTYAKGTRPSTNTETSAFNEKDNIIQNFITEEDPHSSNININTRLYFNKKLNSEGRNVGLNSSFTTRKEDNDLLSNFERVYFPNAIDSAVYFDQLRTRYENNQNFSFNLKYTEPLLSNTFVDLSAEYKSGLRNNNIKTQQQYPTDQDWTVIDNLSNDFERKENEMGASAGIRYQKKKVQVNFSLKYDHLNFNNYFSEEYATFDENYRFFSPNLRIVLDGWRFNYRYDYDLPDINQLHPITDNTNPLYIREGNPDLTPTRDHRLYLSKFQYSGKWKYRIYFSGGFSDESIINTTYIDKNGVTFSKPVNYEGSSMDLYGGPGINRTFEMENQKLSVDLDVYMNFNTDPFSVNGQEGTSRRRSMGVSTRLNYNLNEVLDFSPRYHMGFSKTTYENVDYPEIKTPAHYLSGNLTIHLPWAMEFQNDVTYQYIPVTAPGYRNSRTMWNAALNKKVLSSKKLTIRLSAFDLLDQNISFYRYARYNTVNTFQEKTLKRYFMLSVIYDFRKSGGNNRRGPVMVH